MTQYTEQQAGQPWQRFYEAKINTPLNETANITFYEEIVINSEAGTIKQPVTACTKVIIPEEQIPVLDPATGEPTGTSITNAELYKYLYSLYVQTAKARDNQTFGPVV